MKTPSHQSEQEENFFKNFLIRSAGADPEVLHHCPSEERTRYLIIGWSDQLRFLNKKLIEVASAQTAFEEKLLQLQSEKVRLDLIEQSQRVFDEFVAFLRKLINQMGAPPA